MKLNILKKNETHIERESVNINIPKNTRNIPPKKEIILRTFESFFKYFTDHPIKIAIIIKGTAMPKEKIKSKNAH